MVLSDNEYKRRMKLIKRQILATRLIYRELTNAQAKKLNKQFQLLCDGYSDQVTNLLMNNYVPKGQG